MVAERLTFEVPLFICTHLDARWYVSAFLGRMLSWLCHDMLYQLRAGRIQALPMAVVEKLGSDVSSFFRFVVFLFFAQICVRDVMPWL